MTVASGKGRTATSGLKPKPDDGQSSPRRRNGRSARDFYGAVLEAAEQAALESAREMQGLDEEIALLRVKLQSALSERPEDYELLMKCVSLMVRAVSTRYRISGKDGNDLAESVAGVLQSVGQVLWPEDLSSGG